MKPVFGGFETRLKFIKFVLKMHKLQRNWVFVTNSNIWTTNSFRTRCCKPSIFQTQILLFHRIHTLKYQRSTTSESEFNEFEPRLKSVKNRFQLSSCLNFETLNTILVKPTIFEPRLKFKRGSNSLNSASGCKYIDFRKFELRRVISFFAFYKTVKIMKT